MNKLMNKLKIETKANEMIGGKFRENRYSNNSKDRSTTGSLLIDERKIGAYLKRQY